MIYRRANARFSMIRLAFVVLSTKKNGCFDAKIHQTVTIDAVVMEIS